MTPSSESVASKNDVAFMRPTSMWPRMVAVLLTGLLASGILMRVGAFSPSNVLGAENHTQLFSAHAALVLSTAFIALVYFAPTKKPTESLRVILAGAQLVGATMVVFSEAQVAVLLGCGTSAVVTVLFALSLLDTRSWAGALFLIASVAQVAAWVGTMLGASQLGGATVYPLVLATLAAPLLPPRSSARPLLLVAILTYLLARTAVRFVGLSPLALVELIAGVAVASAVIRSAGREPTPWLRWVRRIEGALFAEAVFLTSFLGIVTDPHLSDTLFAVGAAHLEGLVLVFAFLRALAPAGHMRWGWTGLSFGAVGAHVFCWGNVVLGSRGTPRRYAQYLAQFSVPQAVASVGALALCVGALLLGASYLASRRASPLAR